MEVDQLAVDLEQAFLDGEKMTEKDLADATKVARVKVTLPGPTAPLDSHPDNVKAFMDKWNMIPGKNGPEVMAALGASSAPSVAAPTATPMDVAQPGPTATPAPTAAASIPAPKAALTPPVTTPAAPVETPVETPTVAPPTAAPPTLTPQTTEAETGLQEMERLVHATQAQGPGVPGVRPAQPARPTPDSSANWSSHKKEGMRLTRMMDANAQAYPHMAKMWEGSKKDRKKS